MSSKGALNTGATGRITPVNFRATRSNTKSSTQQPSTTSQAATLEKKKTKVKEIEKEARRMLKEEGCLNEDADITLSTILQALTLIIQKYNATAPQSLTRALTALAALMQEANGANTQFTPVIEVLTQKLGERIETAIHDGMDKVSTLIKSTVAEQCKTLNNSETMIDAVSTLKQVATDMSKTIGEATTATSQINDTALTYKQALISTAAQVTQVTQRTTQLSKERTAANPDDTGLTQGLDKKARQVLLDTTKGEENPMNIYEIKEKAAAALAEIVPAPPQGAEIQEVFKLRNGSMILQFASKEAADWLRIPVNEAAFTCKFDPDTIIRDRVHPIMVPRIPITFDPNNPKHLREVEEVNRMHPNAIKKARWIKPTYRRTRGQSCAHAIFTISTAADANRLLKDGIYVCNARTFPKKLKHEPKQCMKCRRWGHYAAECRAQKDTCGTCGGQHKTSECESEDKRYCVSCKASTHTSWDRSCPEFLRKCDEYSKFHPENSLTYFPTDEDWTRTARPERIPFEDKFPSHFSMGSLPPPNRTMRQPPTRPIGKKNKRPNNGNNNETGQAVMENFFVKIINQEIGPGDVPPAHIDDGEYEDQDTQYKGAHNDTPAGTPQVHKI